MNLKVGDKAPDFTLPDQKGNVHKLSDNLGKCVLVYFYPRDNTPGCTKEACKIRDFFPDFNKLDIAVFGISTDTVQSHAKFAEKYTLPFILLADPEKEVVNKYGAWALKKFMGREYFGTLRISYLINTKGEIAKIYEKVKPDIHAEEVLRDYKNLSSSQKI